MSTYEQFTEFGVDSFGLERTLRLLQSLAHITLSTPSLLLSSPILPSGLQTLRSSLNLSRRTIRTFRFLACFSSAQSLYSASAPLSLEAWLDVTKMTLLGLYGLLETVTLPDLAGAEGFFGDEVAARLNAEAQRFWLLALVCGVLAGLLRLFALEAYVGVPATGAGFSADEKKGKGGKKVVKEKGEKDEKEKELAAKSAGGEKKRALLRKLAVEAVDICLPAAALGWVDVDPSVVGWAMLFTTVVSMYDVWDGVGATMRLKAAKA
ncbi:uncharacterized protein DNG_07487 [Cephalotrichum gorgonifer]|uniref:PEX11 domain-containing protein n=1 Tax=Cephalotrichum gorgonifer TaxID=2041049 RepID=A0AAE8SY93_9PEZI|nr:uncharacterized protein DNG_07487 [Cephalotrichum gorgonifer]